MSRSSSDDTDRIYSVQFILEVTDRAFAEFVLDALPDTETASVDVAGYKTYVDEAGLEQPAVGASIPFCDRAAAESLYGSIPDLDGFDQSVESGTLAIREQCQLRPESTVVTRIACP